MLLELTITNFAIIDQLRLSFGPHLDVFTGETGAGKSIIVDAISALVGERMTSDVVRAGSERAVVEGIFDVTPLLARRHDSAALRAVSDGEDGAREDANEAETLPDLLLELDIEPEDGALILTREILQSGRGIARINRRTVPLSSLQRLARFLVDIHGQSAHLALLRPEQHVFYLDRYANTEDLQAQVANLVTQWRATRREIERLRRDEREIERRIELLRYQVDEITAAQLRVGELDELEAERRRLANAERLGELCVTVYGVLSGDSENDSPGALDLLATAQSGLAELLRLDDTLREQAAPLDQALYLLQDVASTVRSYQDEVAADPQRQAEVEERLDLIAKLRRKYGATIEEILEYAESAGRELDELMHREERATELQARDEELRTRIGALATQLSQRRVAAGERLAAAMERELDDLNMQRARFQVHITQQEDPNGVPARLDLRDNNSTPGFSPRPASVGTLHATSAGGEALTSSPSPRRTRGSGGGGETPRNVTQATQEHDAAQAAQTYYACTPTGIDRVEFLIAPNLGEPLKPLARIASGGETSRLMLALKTILSRADIVPLLIFDEIDSGISGRSGQVVGEKLWQLGQTHQVLCVTHLPQIAALGDEHYRVAKVLEGNRTMTRVEPLAEDERVVELSQMLGGANTAAARANARDLLHRASEWKAGSSAASHLA